MYNFNVLVSKFLQNVEEIRIINAKEDLVYNIALKINNFKQKYNAKEDLVYNIALKITNFKQKMVNRARAPREDRTPDPWFTRPVL